MPPVSAAAPPAVIVDIDGTLALRADRGPFDWDRVGEDLPNLPVVRLVEALAASGSAVLAVSGRMETCRVATAVWLRKYLAGTVVALLMRPDDDFRPDVEVKAEIYRRDIEPRWAVWCVVDDRDSVVAMWRGLGLMCAQVAPGAF